MPWFLAALAFGAAVSAPALYGQGTPSPNGGDFTISVTTDVSLGEPVVLDYVLTNRSVRDTVMSLRLNGIGGLTYALTPPAEPAIVVQPTEDRRFRLSARELQPGESYREQSALNRWLPFSTPGTYELRVLINGRAGNAQAGSPIGVFTIAVGPRDPERMRTRCEALIQGALRCCGMSADDAGEQLASIRDPVVIPFLKRAISAGNSAFASMLNALVEIGTPEARQALQDLTIDPTDWVARNAKLALARMKPPR